MTHSQDTERRATAGHSATSDELWQQLGHAVSLDTSENQVVWTIFGLFWAADAILLVALFTTISAVLWIVAFFGFWAAV